MNHHDLDLHPFGNPEGARADLDDFVGFEGRPRFAGLATSGDDLSARIFVGRKGDGKTIFIRRQQAHVKNDASLYVDSIAQDFPNTNDVVRFTTALEPVEQVAVWRIVWKRAIVRALASHMMFSTTLRGYVPEAEATTIVADYGSLLGTAKAPTSVYSQVTSILGYGSPETQRFRLFLNDPRWDELEYRIASMLKQAPPVCFFLDALDEEFRLAPQQWLKCQHALLLQISQMLNDERIGGRLHLTVGLRDIVYSSVLREDHSSRYRNAPHIRVLGWNAEAISYLLEAKIERLDPRYRFRDGGADSVAGWLGQATVYNRTFGVAEPVADYLLRHTRLIPRDIVQLGNALCQQIVIAKERDGATGLSEDTIRGVVSHSAKLIGEEQLQIAATQLRADQMPMDAPRAGYEDLYVGHAADHYARGLTGTIRDLVREHLADRFEPARLENFRAAARAQFGDTSDLATVLWQHGLLGYEQDSNSRRRAVFHSAAGATTYLLPSHRERYFLHPILNDAIDGLTIGGEAPISPTLGDVF